MIDWDRVTQLKEEVGEEDFQEVVDIFLEEMGDEMKTFSPDLSATELEAKMHFLKGAALNLGLSKFAELCRFGEDSAREGHTDTVGTAAVIACYQESIDVFTAALDGSAAA
ncbi:MAG: Hpt domain-containing protein [Pseudomonadota bacterium]